jgi:predicted Zn-dependent protease
VKDAEPDFPRPAGPADDPGEEYARLLGRGEEAFGDLEYGRAAQRFRQAVRLRPAEARAHFLLAQALLAQGKYHAAHDAILAGLERDPAWPARPFRPLALYGDAVAEYPAQLAALRATRARHPDDPVLLFLWAYQLWFDGRKDEAVGVFRRALAAGAGREGVEKFLRTLPPEEL